MPDLLSPNPADQLAPNTQRRVRVLDKLIDTSANVVGMIELQIKQRFEASKPGADPAEMPGTPIINDLVGAIEKLGKCIRHTVALAEHLEHPPKKGPSNPSPAAPKPARQVPLDPARMTDAELVDALAKARERERAEKYGFLDEEKPEKLDRSFAQMIDIICRTLDIPELPFGTFWRYDFLAELMPIMDYVEEYRATAPAKRPHGHFPHGHSPDDHPPNNPSTAPPDS